MEVLVVGHDENKVWLDSATMIVIFTADHAESEERSS